MYFTTDIVSQLSKVPVVTINKHVRTKKLTPAIRGNGQGKSHQFTESQVLALGLSQGLQALGMGGDIVADVLKRIGKMTSQELRKQFEHKNRAWFLLIQPGKGIMPGFVPAELLQDQNTIKRSIDKFGVPPYGIDVKLMYEKMLVTIEKMERSHARSSRQTVTG